MAAISNIERLNRRIANNHPDPETRLLRDLDDLPDELRRSPSVQLDAMMRVATEERLLQGVKRAAALIEASGDTLLRRIDADASQWAEHKHMQFLNSAMQKASRTMPVNVEARRRAYIEIAIGMLVIFVIAWVALIGAQKVGWVPQPGLTLEEHRQLRWAKEIVASGQTGAIDWAVAHIDSEEKLLEAKAAVAASDKGQSVRGELRDLKACQAEGMQLWRSPSQGTICWFHYRVAP